MQTLQRRRTDHTPADDSPAAQGPDDAARAHWLERCAARISEIDPQLSRDEVGEIARTMQAFERTAAMEPEVAVDFVVSEMRTSSVARFERRGTKTDWSDATRKLGG